MKNDNIVNFVFYQEKHSDLTQERSILSEDLCTAIEILIQRLRDNTPIPSIT